jgi:AcrR family transcriptional regulator
VRGRRGWWPTRTPLGRLYRQFPTKESLYDAVLEAWAEKVNGAVDPALALDAPERAQLLTWLTDYSAMLRT